MGTQTTNTAPQSTTNAQGNGSLPLPQSDRDVEHLQGHWLLARIGKRVLRPGGKKLTGRMLAKTELEGKDVVEFAPGLGRTTQLILERKPKSYRGVDRDPQVVDIITKLTAENAPSIPTSCALHDAADTGLESESADAVIGEAMLTMQTERGKRAIIAEAYRLLRAAKNRFGSTNEIGVFEMDDRGLREVPNPSDLPEPVKDEVRKALARSIKVNARPLTEKEWRELLKSEGFEVLWSGKEPMALLDMRRNLADEGLGGVLRILRNMLGNKDIRARVMNMKSTFHKYSKELNGIAFVVRKPAK